MDNCIVLDDLYRLELLRQLDLFNDGTTQAQGIVQGLKRIIDQLTTAQILAYIVQLQKINRTR